MILVKLLYITEVTAYTEHIIGKAFSRDIECILQFDISKSSYEASYEPIYKTAHFQKNKKTQGYTPCVLLILMHF